MIKLKVGSQSKTPTEPIERASQSTKPPKRKSKPAELPAVLDAPPPPYVDDGSHDILQEVLAIEREKKEQRHRIPEREKSQSATVVGKRRKVDVEEEDDILALAAPSKKERPTPPGPSTNVKTYKNSPASTPKPAETSVKPKKDRTVDSSRSSMVVDQPLPPSLKGKEREVSKPSPAPASGPAPAPPQNKPRKTAQSTPINVKKCKDLMKVLCKLPESEIFLRPVDVVLDGCPT